MQRIWWTIEYAEIPVGSDPTFYHPHARDWILMPGTSTNEFARVQMRLEQLRWRDQKCGWHCVFRVREKGRTAPPKPHAQSRWGVWRPLYPKKNCLDSQSPF